VGAAARSWTIMASTFSLASARASLNACVKSLDSPALASNHLERLTRVGKRRGKLGMRRTIDVPGEQYRRGIHQIV
jgi:hypothetical protein